MNISNRIRDHFKVYLRPLPERIYNLKGSSIALFLTLMKENFLFITRTEEDCQKIFHDYNFYKSIHGGNELFHFPEPEDIIHAGKQVEIMLRAVNYPSMIASLNACQTQLKGVDELKKEVLLLKQSMEISRENLAEKLNRLGYKKVSMVVDRGEFSIRNYILDLYPANRDEPLRIEFFGDEIDSIRLFSIDTQRTIDKINEVLLLPLRQTGGSRFIYDIFDFSHIFCMEDAVSTVKSWEFRVKNWNSRVKESPDSELPTPNFFTILSPNPIGGEGMDARSFPITGKGIYPDERKSIKDLSLSIERLKVDNRVIVVCPSTAQAERIRDILMEGDMVVPVIKLENVNQFSQGVSITTGRLSEGLFISGLLILTDREMFGEIQRHRPIKKSHVSTLLQSLDELNQGDYVVHDDHGIGIFEELRKERADGFETDMVVIQYAKGTRLYLPVYGINHIKKYWAEEGVIPRLDSLGGRTWQKTKKRVKNKVKVTAEKLIKHYAEREITKGFSFSGDTEIHREFDNFFPYEETPDQITAVKEIKGDLESKRAMDRLLCGDVGYGKTEVAMRAAFKTVYEGRQVVILVPTTILCEQHYLTFKERFSAFPVSIDYLSRFKTRKEIQETLKRLSRGEIDIIIGTHGLLRKDINIPNIGLLIIDEEHRFGVTQKERIKELKRGVDCLSMSATPIPRTLQMSLSGIWNMSTIDTPPEERLAVRTFISIFNKDIIKEALDRELDRDGQVFFVHNRIENIEKMANMVKTLVPGASVAMAHGRMKEKELEEIMIEFIKRRVDILVSTSIIGSGIDIPSANTIIINRADKLGLADLYQLRGRVGRSNVRAYAYFFIPGKDIITEEAKKRLIAIQEMSYLGAGLRLAMKDLEIRGAGNLLGAEQSGHIHAVGFDTYMEMLEREIANLKGVVHEREIEPFIDLRVEAFLPDDYIEDVSLRLSFYRRIAVAKEADDLYSLKDEMVDRFGKLPQRVENLFEVMRLKLICKEIRATSVKQVKDKVQILFSEDTPISMERLLKLQNIIKEQLKFLEKGVEIHSKELGKNDDLRMLIDILRSLMDSPS